MAKLAYCRSSGKLLRGLPAVIENRKSTPFFLQKLTDDECELGPQNQFGVLFEPNGFILFQAQVLEVSTVAFLVDIFARPSAAFSLHEPAELIGSCYIMPNHFTSTSGTIKDTIISSSKFEAIGDICMDFLVIKSMENATCDFAVTFAKHWKPVWKGIDVGHRGLGNSYTKAERYFWSIWKEVFSEFNFDFFCPPAVLIKGKTQFHRWKMLTIMVQIW